MAISMARAEDRGADLPGAEQARRVLAGFGGGLYRCLTRRGDELFEVGDAMLCADGPVQDLARLSLGRGGRGGRRARGGSISGGRGRWRAALRGGRIGGGMRWWGRGRGGSRGREGDDGWVGDGWRGKWSGVESWRRPDDDETEVTAGQARDVVARLIEAGHWRQGDPAVLIVPGAGYDVTRLAWLLADLPVEVLGRLRADRVMQLPAPPRRPAPWAGRASTAGSWRWPTRRPGRTRRSPPAP